MQADELNKALRAAGTMRNPILPHSAFELFSRAQQANSTEQSNAEILCAWNAAKPRTKREYEEAAQQEQHDQTHATHQHMERVLKKVYAVELAKDDEYTRTAVFVQGAELRLRTMDLQEAYQTRVTKIKLTVQVSSFQSKLACVLLIHALFCCTVCPNQPAAERHISLSTTATDRSVPRWH